MFIWMKIYLMIQKKKKLAKIVNMCLVKDIEKIANINQILSIFN